MYWEDQEISQLRSSFLTGTSLKGMAKILNKSPGAVNKALTRFNIRPPSKPKTLWSAVLKEARKPAKASRPSAPFVSLRDTATWRSSGTKAMSIKPDKHWVQLREVIEFLQKQGESISIAGHEKAALYYMNKRPTSPTQLLVRANQYRSDMRLQPYYVESLTH